MKTAPLGTAANKQTSPLSWPGALIWPAFIALYLYVLTQPFLSMAKWIAFITFGAGISFCVVWNKFFPYSASVTLGEKKSDPTTAIAGILIFLPGFSIMFQILSKSNDIPDFLRQILFAAALIASALIGFIVSEKNSFLFLKQPSSALLIIAIGSTTSLSIVGTRIGTELKSISFYSPALALSLAALLGAVFARSLSLFEKRSGRTPRRALFAGMIVLTSVMAFRTDAIFSIPGARYHWSYFTGVIETIRSGGTLLWDTPSQYGLGPVLLPSLLPISSSTQAFFTFQAILMIATAASVLGLLMQTRISNFAFGTIGFIWTLIFFFSDPSLIGPQPYPSSSAVRFGPSVVLVCYLIHLEIKKKTFAKKTWHHVFLALIFSIAFYWSAESAIYSTTILVAFALSRIFFRDELTVRGEINKILLSIASGVALFGCLAFLIVFTRSGNLPDPSIYLVHTLGYASGFGSLPLEIASPIWVLVLTIGALSYNHGFFGSNSKSSVIQRSTVVLLGASGSWYTYFVGRAVPDNVIAMLPLISFALLMILSIAITENQKTGLKNHTKANTTNQLWLAATTMITLCICTLVLIVPLVKFLNPGWIEALRSDVRIPTWSQEMDATNELTKALNAIRGSDRHLPIAYEGFNSILPNTSRKLDWKPVVNENWLPTPLGLLEEPVKNEKRIEYLQRYVTSTKRAGILVFDLKNSFGERNLSWKTNLNSTHECVQLFKSEHYEVIKCLLRS